MKETREALISELISKIHEEEQSACRRIIQCLAGLGYAPYRENVSDYVISFKSKEIKQTIAKIGVRKDKGVFYRIKFYACKNPPEKFADAVRDAVVKTNGQYRCSDCGVCGAEEGERGYSCLLPDGTQFLRCGAYVVEIPNLTPEDVGDYIRLLNEQHVYFRERTMHCTSSVNDVVTIRHRK